MAQWLADKLTELAPNDLADVPLYVVLASEIPDDYLPPDAGGIAGKDIDLLLQSHLESTGEWAGRGRGLIVCNYSAESVAREKVELMGADYLATRDAVAIGIALHELAHSIEVPPDLSERDHNEVREQHIQANELPRYREDSLFWRVFPKWYGHEARFIRTLCHLCARAAVAGWEFDTGIAWNHEFYGLSPLANYAAALGEEVNASADLTFAEILATRPPEQFITLWQNDIKVWAITNDKPLSSIEAHLNNFPGNDPIDDTEQNMRFASLQAADVGEITGDGVMILAALGATPIAAGTAATIRALAYGGGLLGDTVIDLAGLTRAPQVKVTLDGKHIGHVSMTDTSDGKALRVTGRLYPGKARDEIYGSAQNGFLWLPRIDVAAGGIEHFAAGKTAEVNGRTFPGPVNVSRKSRLLAVVLGGDGDDDTELQIESE